MAGNEAPVVEGRCLCGTVRYRLRGPFEQMVHCHCGMCRKAHGSSFATFVAAPAAGFEWLAGQDAITGYQSSAQGMRWFCRHCGSVTPAPQQQGELVWLPAGTLTQDCATRPVAHMFTDSRAAWVEIDDALTNFAAAPPGYTAPDLPPSPSDAAEGLTGGCLCGRIRYRLSGAPLVMVNCHCSRCRRARGAAHATNLFVLPEQLTWLSGEADVEVFDLPEAERFGQNFCPTCGGPVPRSSPKIGRVNVPAGSLDGDPGIRPGYHIYVASKAPWFDIHDGLPQHAERPQGS